MSESDYYATSRPRIKKESFDDLQQIKEKLNHMLDNEEETDYIKERFTGKQGKLSKAEIIDEALDALQDRGLIDK